MEEIGDFEQDAYNKKLHQWFVDFMIDFRQIFILIKKLNIKKKNNNKYH